MISCAPARESETVTHLISTTLPTVGRNLSISGLRTEPTQTSIVGFSRRMAYLLSHRIDVILGCLAIAATVPARAQHPEPGPYRIAAVRAFLYFNQKDSLSANIADTSADALFNTPMGGTFDPNPSEEVLIKVEIMGERRRYASGRKIHLTVKKTDGTVLVDRRPRIGLFSEKSDKWFETFAVYETG